MRLSSWPRDKFEKFRQEVLPDGMIVFTFDNGSVFYRYEFTEI